MWPGDSGFTVLFEDAPDPDDLDDGDELPEDLVCLHCLLDDHPELGRGLDIAREYGVADLDGDGEWVVGEAGYADGQALPSATLIAPSVPRGQNRVALWRGDHAQLPGADRQNADEDRCLIEVGHDHALKARVAVLHAFALRRTGRAIDAVDVVEDERAQSVESHAGLRRRPLPGLWLGTAEVAEATTNDASKALTSPTVMTGFRMVVARYWRW